MLRSCVTLPSAMFQLMLRWSVGSCTRAVVDDCLLLLSSCAGLAKYMFVHSVASDVTRSNAFVLLFETNGEFRF